MYEVIIRKSRKPIGRMTGENVYLIVESDGQLTQSRFEKEAGSNRNTLVPAPREPTPVLRLANLMNGKDPEVLNMVALVTMTILEKREKHILESLSQGMTREEIAAEMNFSSSTVKRLMQSLVVKLGSQDYVEALSKYLHYKGIVGDIPLLKQEDFITVFTDGGNVALTPRQMQVVTCAMRGLKCFETAQELNLSMSTVKRERRNIFDKTGVGSMIEVVAVMADTWGKGEAENDMESRKNGGDETS